MLNVPIRATGEAVPVVSRRAFLRTSASAGLATVSAGGMAVIATSSQAAEQPDAELIALGAEFAILFEQELPLGRACDKVAEQFRTETESRYRSLREGTPDYEAYWRDYAAFCRKEDDAHLACTGRMDAIVQRMHELSATTLAGFAAKARTLRWDLNLHGRNPDPESDWDWDEICLERFIRDIERAGAASDA